MRDCCLEKVCLRNQLQRRLKRLSLVVALFGFIVLSSLPVTAQTTGDYRTVDPLNSSSWSDPLNWERYNGSSFVAATAYPGEINGDAQTVTILSSGDPALTLDLSPAFSIVNLGIQDGASTELDINGQTITITGDLTVDGDLIDNAGPGVISLGGNLVINSTATVGTGGLYFDINFSGTGTQTISGSFAGTAEFFNFNKSASGTLDNNLAATIEIGGQFLLSAGTFQAGSGTYNLGFATTNGYCFDKSGGTFTEETSTFIVKAGANTRIRTDANITFYNLTHNPGATRSLTFDESNAGSASFTISNVFERAGTSSSVSLLNSATVAYASNATLKYSITSAANIASEWPSSSGPDNITNSASANVTLTASRTVTGTLSLEQNSGNFQISGGSTVLTINGILQRKRGGTIGLALISGGTIQYGASSELAYAPGGNDSSTTVGAEFPSANGPRDLTVNCSNNSISARTVVMPAADRSISGTFYITAGTLQHALNNVLFIGGNITAAITGSGYYTNGKLILNGTANQTISGNAELSKVTVDKTTGGGDTVIVQASAIIVSDSVNVRRGALRVGQGASATIGNAGSGALVVESGALFQLSTGANSLTMSNRPVQVLGTGIYRTGGKTIDNFSSITLSSTSTFIFDGNSSAETMPIGVTSYGTIRVSNPSNVQLPASLNIVAENLDFTSGLLITEVSGSTLTINQSITNANSTRFVAGPLRRRITDNSSYSFPVGVLTGIKYRPATLNYIDFTGGSNEVLEVYYKNLDPTGLKPAGVSVVSNSAHYTVKSISGTRPSSTTLNLTLRYTDTGFQPESRNRMLRQIATLLTDPSYALLSGETLDEGNDDITVNGITDIPTNDGIFTFGSGGATVKWDGGQGNGEWTSPANWDFNVVPGSTDDVILDNSLVAASYTVTLSGSSAQTISSLIIGDGAGNTVTLNITNTNSAPLTITENTGTPLDVLSDGTLTINGSNGGVDMSANGNASFANGSTFNITTGTGITTSGTKTFGASSTTNVASTNASALAPATYGILNITNASGTISTSGNVSSQDFTKSGGGNLTITGDLAITGTLSKSGSGTLTVTGGNCSTTGSASISGGTLSIEGTGGRINIGTTTNTTGGILTIAATATGNSSFGTAFTNGGTLNVSGSGTTDFSSTMNNTGTINLNTGAGTVSFTGAYSGNGTISAAGATPNTTFAGSFTPGGTVTFGSQTLAFQNDVTVAGGSLTLSSNSIFSGNFDFEVNGGAVATSSGNIAFTTGTGQTITGNVTFPSLTINNANGVTISSGSLPTVSGTLTLTDGLVNFANNADYLTLNAASTVSGGSSSSFVNGKVRKIFATGSNISSVFPIGKPTGRFQAVTVAVGTVTGSNQHITIEQIETNIVPPLTTGINAPLVAVSRIRYWNVAYAANGGSMTNPTIRLSWDNNGAGGIADGVAGIVGSSSSADVVIARQSNGTGNWSNLGQSAFTGVYANGPNTNTGTVTSNIFTLTDGNNDFVTFGALNSDVSLPVELTSFEAEEIENSGHVELIWRTESEIENAYWLVQKKTPGTDFETITTIEGQGTKSSFTDYRFIDVNVKAGDSVIYRLADVAYNGDIAYHEEKALKLKVPLTFELLPNYPNPFNPATTISYRLPKQSRVSLTIYNILGQKVRELVRGEVQDVGVQRVSWDSRNDAGSTVATGIYIYRLQIGNFNTSRKMILMK